MNKLKNIAKMEQFWLWFFSVGAGMFVFELLLFGKWAIPILNYRVPFMAEVTYIDLGFAAVFAAVFGFGAALFILARKFNVASCAIGSGSGLLAFFTMLCPICPVFFLAYFGLSTTVMAFAPYFLWFRLFALLLLFLGIVILMRTFKPRDLPIIDGHTLFQKIAIILMGVLLVANQAFAAQIGKKMLGENTGDKIALTGEFSRDIAALVTPSSLPFYGPELRLDMSSLNKINESIKKLAAMAPKQGSNPIQLNEEEMKRYIDIGTEPYITCEFCCGVKTLVREDGSPTCGCAHSIAMRGTAAYLIRNYPEMSNEEISYELVRQKGLYFPTQMQKRMVSSLAGDVADFKPDIKYLTMRLSQSELKDLQEKARTSGFEPEQDVGMVGGC